MTTCKLLHFDMKVRRCLYYSVNDENQHDKRASLEHSEVTAGRPKAAKVSRLSAPLPGTPRTPATAAASAKGSAKKATGEIKSEAASAAVEDTSFRRGGKACDKIACVRAGLKPSCFVGATQRCVVLC